MRKVLFGLVALSLMGGTASWAAQAKTAEARLVAPLAAPVRVIVDGRLWTCEADVCKGSGQGASQPLRRECARVAKAVGPIAAYRNGERSLDAAGVAACNAG